VEIIKSVKASFHDSEILRFIFYQCDYIVLHETKKYAMFQLRNGIKLVPPQPYTCRIAT
jgi:hypothetical protein